MINYIGIRKTNFKESTQNKPLILFLHIPKTGGSSLTSILKKQYRDNEIIELNPHSLEEDNKLIAQEGIDALGNFGFKKMNPEDIEKLRQFAVKEESKAVFGHFPFGIHDYIDRATQYFTTLRNPQNLVLSLYHEMFKSDDNFDVALVKKFQSLEDFASYIGNVQTFILSGFSKYKQLLDNPEQAFAKAIENINKHFIHIGTLEAFDKSIKITGKKLHWKNKYKTEHLRKGDYNRNQITTDTYKLLSENNRLDEELYDYVLRKFKRKFFGQI